MIEYMMRGDRQREPGRRGRRDRRVLVVAVATPAAVAVSSGARLATHASVHARFVDEAWKTTVEFLVAHDIEAPTVEPPSVVCRTELDTGGHFNREAQRIVVGSYDAFRRCRPT